MTRWIRQSAWWALDYLYVAKAQLRGWRRALPADFAEGSRELPAVVLIQGIYEPWSLLEPIAKVMNDAGYRVFDVPALSDNRVLVKDAALLVAQRLSQLATKDGVDRVVLVAHSKGGLVGKTLMLAGASGAEASPKIIGLVAVATPFTGSRYARFFPDKAVREFSPRGPLISGLLGQAAVNGAITSVYGTFDPHIPGGSSMPGARNIQLPVTGHFKLLGDSTVAATVLGEVRRLDSGAD